MIQTIRRAANWVWNFNLFADEYEQYVPVQMMPNISFQKTVKVKKGREKPLLPPVGYTETQTVDGLKYAKGGATDDGLEYEITGARDKLLSVIEWVFIMQKYPSVNKDAVVIAKRMWAENKKTVQIVTELKKRNTPYSNTYVKFFCKVFNDYKPQNQIEKANEERVEVEL